jgi:catechol 2,3-dioxygenase-like lactoylglutathione lyase family enzyme
MERSNVRMAVPFFMVDDIEKSVRFYVDKLGFELTNSWRPDGKLKWGWLTIGDAAVMLQEFWRDGNKTNRPQGTLGAGVSICFTCDDALAIYREFKSRDVEAKRPFVGNGMWVTSVSDPDGYALFFESLTDAPEESVYEEESSVPG